VATAPADAGLRRVSSSPALLAMVQHSAAAAQDDGRAEVTELRHEVAELREQVEDLELKVSKVARRPRVRRARDDRSHCWRVCSAWSGLRARSWLTVKPCPTVRVMLGRISI